MRYFGTFTGKKLKEGTMTTYSGTEDKQDWPCFYAEIKDVTDESGMTYGTLLAYLSGKTALRYREYVLENNDISFDCSGIEAGIINRMRNICSNKILVGKGLPTEAILNNDEYKHEFRKDPEICGNSISCIYCKYRKNKKMCNEYNTF